MTSLHLAFTTPDLDATAAFYAKLFDVAPDKREVDYVRFTVAEPALVLSLRPGPAGPLGTGVDHLGLRLSDSAAVAAARERLTAAGLPSASEEAVSCCYAVQDKTWVADPDGRPWEVYTVLADVDVLADRDSGCCATAAPPRGESCCA